MRVSVVATGIDASQSRLEPPMPRRSMAAMPAPRQMEEPRQAQPAARQPAPQPVVAQRAAPVQQPAPRPAPVAEPEEPAYDAHAFGHDDVDHVAEDDLPPPAYRPAPAPRPEPVAEAPQPVAPRGAQAPGTPTPEALARLRAMASRAAEARAADPRAPAQAPAQGGPAEKPRFGINSLINRMTGTSAEAQAPAAPPRTAAQPRQAYEAQPEPEAERADIPAFLRRQAN
jgi:cell division protein FtsZ